MAASRRTNPINKTMRALALATCVIGVTVAIASLSPRIGSHAGLGMPTRGLRSISAVSPRFAAVRDCSRQTLKAPRAVLPQDELLHVSSIFKHHVAEPIGLAAAVGSSLVMGGSAEDSNEVGMARVGPNTLIQTVGALKEKYGEEKAAELLRKAGYGYLANDLPTSMVQEMNFHNLVRGLEPLIGDEELSEILFNAGSGTAQYLLRVRIPGFFQELVKILPKKPALQLLLFAIGKAGAWTFRGSGEYYTQDVKEGTDIHVTVKYPSLPLVSNFYRGVFDYLIHTLVDVKMPVVPKTDVSADGIDCTISCKL